MLRCVPDSSFHERIKICCRYTTPLRTAPTTTTTDEEAILFSSGCNGLTNKMSSFYLELLENPLKFPPVTEDNNVFFDEGNKEVFSVSRADSYNSVKVKRAGSTTTSLDFKVPDKGHVISIKFSPNHRILAIQRSLKSVDLMNVENDEIVGSEYSQTCKGRSTQIMGFIWTSLNELVIVTNQGVEFYQVLTEKSTVKQIKSFSVNVNWFVFLAENSVLLLSSGIMGNVIHPYIFRPGSVSRLAKFEVENPATTRVPQPGGLHVRDVTVANIYGQIYVVVLRNQPRMFNSIGAEVALYQLQRDMPAKKTTVLRLGSVGRFAVNVVDNLIVVHHQASKTSMIFDLKSGGEYDGQISYHYPVLSPLPIQPCRYAPNTPESEGISKPEVSCDLYSPNWIVFQPNIIIDAKLGCLWQVRVKLESLVNMIEDKGQLIDFLSLREDSKSVLLSVCMQMLLPGRQASLSVVAQVFDKLNSVYRDYLQVCADRGGAASPDNSKDAYQFQSWFRGQSIIDQSDMYDQVFAKFLSYKQSTDKFVMGVLVEYIRSLISFQIPVEFYLIELVINQLVKTNKFHQMHQFLQYSVLQDSKELAFLLLTLEGEYPPAFQLALDMLKRIQSAKEEIVEVLLSKQQVIPALRYLDSVDALDSSSPRKFLEAALKTEDNMTFYTVFMLFQKRNIRLRKQPGFAPGEQCDVYEQHFSKIFGKDRNTNDVDGLVEIIEGLHY